MAAAASVVAHGSKVLPYWLILTYLLHTFRRAVPEPGGLELCDEAVAAAPGRADDGMWFLSLSLGNLAAGLIAGEFDANNVAAMPGQYLHIVYFAVGLGVVLFDIEPAGEAAHGERRMSAEPSRPSGA